MKNTANYQIKGIATLLIRDKNTLDIKKVITEENFVADNLDHKISESGLVLYISEADNELTPRTKAVGKSYIGSNISGINKVTRYYYPTVATPYIEVHQRFAAPTTNNRTIRYVGTCLNTSYPQIIPLTVLKLTTPVIQTTSDIIDLIYRLEFIRAAAFDIDGAITGNNGYQGNYLIDNYLGTPSGISTPDNLLPSSYRGSFIASGIGSDFQSYRLNYQPQSSVNSNSIWYDILKRSSFGNQYNNSFNPDKLSETKTETHSFNLDIGTVDQCFFLDNNSSNTTFPIWFNTSYDPNYVKSTFTHSSLTTVPFYDSANTPSSTGKVIPTDGTGTLSRYIPRYHRFKITTTGGVGTSTYQYEYCLFHKFLGNEFDVGSAILDHINIASFDNFLSGRNYVSEPTCIMPIRQPGTEEDSDDVSLLFVFNDTLVIVPIYTLQSPIIINSTTGLNATEITQVYPKDISNIWISCANTGLYYYNGVTITKIDPTTFGLNDPCYGVTGGPGNSVWAMFDGGLAVTTDNGNTWTTYTTATTPSLNLNVTSFADVVSIIGDENHPDNRLAILYKDQTTNDYRTQWWDSVNGSQNVTSFTIGENTTLDNISNRRVYMQRVSVREGVWASAYINNGGTTYQGILPFNSTTAILPSTSLGVSDLSYKTLQPILVKTDTGVNLLAYTSSTTNRTLLDPSGTEQLISPSPHDLSVTSPVEIERVVYVKNGRLIYFQKPVSLSNNYYFAVLTGVSTHVDDPTFAPLTKEYWKSYGWDGTQWVRNNSGSKPTHTTTELVPGDINVSFDDQGGTLTFVAGESYVTTTAYGVVHDGTVDTTVSLEVMERRASKESNTATVPSTPISVTTNFDPRGLKFIDTSSISSITDQYINNTPAKRIYASYGYCRTQQAFDGDFDLEFTITYFGNSTLIVGISSGQVGNPVSTTTLEHGIVLTTSDFKIYENYGTLVYQQNYDLEIFDPTQVFTSNPASFGIKRTGGTIEYYLNNVKVYTSSLTSTGAKNIEISTQFDFQRELFISKVENVLLSDHYLTVNTTPPVSDIRMIPASELSNITINGVAPTTIFVNDYDTPLAAGEISVLESSGLIRFSPSDAGKTVNYTTLLVYNII